MSRLLAWIVVLVVTMVACTPPSSLSPTAAGPVSTTQAITAKATVAVVPTEEPSTSTPVPTKTLIASATPTPATDPRPERLTAEGYGLKPENVPFVVQANTGGVSFGGPDFDHPLPARLSTTTPSGRIYAFEQYVLENSETGNCYLLFFASEQGETKLLAIIDSSQYGFPVDYLFCTVYGWGDVNQNGSADFTVAYLWGNQYTGSQTRIYEITATDQVVDLTADLPGIVSPWSFDPTRASLEVIDLAWTEHDCIYPPILTSWVYAWRDEGWVNISSEIDNSRYLSSLKSLIEQGFGGPFIPVQHLGLTVTLLVQYEKNGQRDKGWAEYLEVTDLKNWPGSDAESLKWLEEDIRHFTNQFERDMPFTPNDFCG